jgi:hypothetical protein
MGFAQIIRATKIPASSIYVFFIALLFYQQFKGAMINKIFKFFSTNTTAISTNEIGY